MSENEIERYWRAFQDSLPAHSPLKNQTYTAESFGDNPELADELADLIVSGIKTATCSTLWEWEEEGALLPEIGALTILLDSQQHPKCIIETTEVDVRPFNEVDERFAYDEGEGDRSLEYWRDAHWRCFTRTLARLGKKPSEKMQLVCERFKVVFT